jgi:hypothetical protein
VIFTTPPAVTPIVTIQNQCHLFLFVCVFFFWTVSRWSSYADRGLNVTHPAKKHRNVSWTTALVNLCISAIIREYDPAQGCGVSNNNTEVSQADIG